MVQTIETGLDKVLAVVTEELHRGKHGKAAVLKLVQLSCLESDRVDVLPRANLEITEESGVTREK